MVLILDIKLGNMAFGTNNTMLFENIYEVHRRHLKQSFSKVFLFHENSFLKQKLKANIIVKSPVITSDTNLDQITSLLNYNVRSMGFSEL